jgi:hypothetical protein
MCLVPPVSRAVVLKVFRLFMQVFYVPSAVCDKLEYQPVSDMVSRYDPMTQVYISLKC